jgi:OmpA-OmpF porin, OOP family
MGRMLGLRAMIRRALIGGALLAAVGGQAAAQEASGDIELQFFQPAVGPRSYFTVDGAETMAPKQFQVELSLTYMTSPLRVYNVPDQMNLGTTRSDVVESIFAGQLAGAYGIRDGLHLAAVLPLTFNMTGDGLNPATGMPESGGLTVNGTGDLRVEAALRVWESPNMEVVAIPAVTIPSSTALGSDDNKYLGDDLPSFRPRAALQWTSPSGRFDAGANLGFIFRKPRQFYSSDVGQQLTYGVASAFHVNPRVDVIAETFGRKGLTSFSDLDSSALELDAGVKVQVMPGISLVAGGGTGLVRGMGSPQMRVFATAAWSPDFRDTDNDGVSNQRDRCPTVAEDKDGFADRDGCPDDDNDQDFIADDGDKCRDQAEDKDGFDDDDGCPEDDNDKDSFLDAKDSCPNDAEDKLPPFPDDGCPGSKRDTDGDGVTDDKDKCFEDMEDVDGIQDEDGCPDLDNDGDAVPDEADKCPDQPEDPDNFADDDGCPELDNDGDGLWDIEDACPSERETVNGVKDTDGCPDRGGKALAWVEEDKVVFKDKFAWDGPRLRSKNDGMLDQVAMVMRGQPQVTKWRIVVAAEKNKDESKQRATSQARADAIKAYLQTKGLRPEQIEAVGAVSDSPTVAIVGIEKNANLAPPDTGTTIEIEPQNDEQAPEIEMEPQ